ncbi:IS66 family transposase [uncultured Enterococcus sp.]|uniref:IS66 family transposase n=1 Tax=uncultured Enterococcus sp. TaxID=167972 RepID=UPI00345B79DB
MCCSKKTGYKAEKLKNIEKHTIIHPLSESEKHCDHCSCEMHKITANHIRTDLIVIPRMILAIEHKQEVYACDHCKRNGEGKIKKSEVPTPLLNNSLASPSIVAEIAIQKFQNKMPVYRLEKEWTAQGYPINRQEMIYWLNKCVEYYLLPVAEQMLQTILRDNIIHIDETPYRVIQAENEKSYFWIFCNGKHARHPACFYHFYPSRGEKAISSIVQSFTGFAHTDGYAVYEKLLPRQKVSCLAHVRRYFIEADGNNTNGKETLATGFIRRLGTIFHLDASYAKLDAEQRKLLRIQELKPRLDQWYQDLEKYRTKKASSKFEKAVNYAFNQREAIYRIFEDGRLELTNNRAERAVKEIVMGRKNWLFSVSEQGARTNAVYQTLIKTAELNHLSPWKYLEWLLTEIKELKAPHLEDYARFLPWSAEAQKYCKVGSICTSVYHQYLKKEA